MRARAARAGDVARVARLDNARIGDLVGDVTLARPLAHEFAPPTLETVVVACDPARRADLHTALTRLAEQDPLIDLRLDEERDETHVSLYGEVQKEVIAATLLDEYGVAATFGTTSVICIERVVGRGEAHEVIDTPPNPFLATVGLLVEPGEPGSGVRFGLAVEAGSMPAAFFTAVEEVVRSTLAQRLLGWSVVDCVVTMTRSGYWPRQSHMHQKFDTSMSSTAGDFRNLTPLVLAEALRRARPPAKSRSTGSSSPCRRTGSGPCSRRSPTSGPSRATPRCSARPPGWSARCRPVASTTCSSSFPA